MITIKDVNLGEDLEEIFKSSHFPIYVEHNRFLEK